MIEREELNFQAPQIVTGDCVVPLSELDDEKLGVSKKTILLFQQAHINIQQHGGEKRDTN